ncbi:phage tail sheath subtilisin-like domain-containing protein [Draconibacterium sp.]|nr:phage tail sheath subtilisin-like domain-containing protein [Draconibacterium sp.]
MATYKTPDVYVEEISIFPPSVAEVESAVPCFIGYTEKAMKLTKDDLLNKAHKIKSMVEYERYFGEGAPLVLDYTDPTDRVEVTLDENNSPQSVAIKPKFYLYDSLKIFFDNGGGKCYIISVGNYNDQIIYETAIPDDITMHDGLEVLKKVDEPTIICFPDAVLLPDQDLYNLQVAALNQCGKLMDRVVVCDLKNISSTTTHDQVRDEFRSKIGINNLKYGAAYTPWLKTNLRKNIKYRDIKLVRTGGSTVQLKNLTTDEEIRNLIDEFNIAIAETNNIKTNIIDANKTSSQTSIKENFLSKLDSFDGDTTLTDFNPMRSALRILYHYIIDVVTDFQRFGNSITDGTGWVLKTDFNSIVSNTDLINELKYLFHHSNGFEGSTIITSTHLNDTHSDFTDLFTGVVDPSSTDATITALYSGEDVSSQGKTARNAAMKVFNVINSAVKELLITSEGYESTFENNLRDALGIYKTIIQKINETQSEIPPSGAIAGIYAFVDRTRGVHKAPANVSLAGVDGLTVDIDFEDQKDLNVDTNAGKSINAIRFFTGKGILVWGARTLAGNDNEWRYVPVRRFYNMVEESIKKSTYWAVFEPNDANLWVRVKGMIENYLFQKWRDGALAGAVPEDAYFVKIGLGLTMTPQDILEGRLNVEIGMAVVRPAEFIILKFSHMMQKS